MPCRQRIHIKYFPVSRTYLTNVCWGAISTTGKMDPGGQEPRPEAKAMDRKEGKKGRRDEEEESESGTI